MWLFQYFVNKTTKAAITARSTTVDRKRRTKDEKLTSYDIVVNYLLRTNATGGIITETDAEINSYRKLARMSPPEYVRNCGPKRYVLENSIQKTV